MDAGRGSGTIEAMRRRAVLRAAGLVWVLVLVPSAAIPARAWEPATRRAIALDALKLMPPTLRTVLERNREPLLRGMLEPMASEDDPSHRPASGGGTLEAEIGEAAAGVTAAVDAQAPFSEVAKRFGLLAHRVSDAAFPPNASGRSGAGHYGHFRSFAESRRPKFPLVFYGHDDAALERADFDAFAARVVSEARREDGNLARAYAAAGNPPAPSAFDDRSIPFAVASLSYSRAVTYVARAWIAAWREANGDLGYTPYMKFRKRSEPAGSDGAPDATASGRGHP